MFTIFTPSIEAVYGTIRRKKHIYFFCLDKLKFFHRYLFHEVQRLQYSQQALRLRIAPFEKKLCQCEMLKMGVPAKVDMHRASTAITLEFNRRRLCLV